LHWLIRPSLTRTIKRNFGGRIFNEPQYVMQENGITKSHIIQPELEPYFAKLRRDTLRGFQGAARSEITPYLVLMVKLMSCGSCKPPRMK
jgi:hypothetical protein